MALHKTHHKPLKQMARKIMDLMPCPRWLTTTNNSLTCFTESIKYNQQKRIIIQSLRAFRRAWGLGSRALGEGSFSEDTRPTWWQHRIEIASKLIKNGANMAAKWALEASWRSLGGLLEPLKRLGRRRGSFQGRMGRSWTPLGGLRALKSKVGIGSWPAQGHQGDWFPIV